MPIFHFLTSVWLCCCCDERQLKGVIPAPYICFSSKFQGDGFHGDGALIVPFPLYSLIVLLFEKQRYPLCTFHAWHFGKLLHTVKNHYSPLCVFTVMSTQLTWILSRLSKAPWKIVLSCHGYLWSHLRHSLSYSNGSRRWAVFPPIMFSWEYLHPVAHYHRLYWNLLV